MNDKELLQKIKNVRTAVKEIYGNVNTITYPIYMVDWLIEQVEKVEQLQQEIASLKEALNESVKTSVALDNELQQAQKRIQYLENELRNCGYSDTDLDNYFLFEFQDKQVGWEEE
jgi:septal ring factor EnvC (AmiA/AmiB activator)